MYQFKVPELNKHYDRVYDRQEHLWRQLCAVDKADNIERTLSPYATEVESVLEVGCGTGDVIANLSRRKLGQTFVGIDVIDPNMNTQALKSVGNLSFVKQTGDVLPFEDRSFDLVFASHVLEHVADERPFLRELERVCRRYIYIEVPCELHIRTSFAALQTTLDIGHINSYTPESFALTLATSGLEILALRCFDHSVEVQAFHSSRLKGLIKRAIRTGTLKLARDLAPRILSYHCGALCRPARPA